MRNLLLLEIVITLAALVTGVFVFVLALTLVRVCGWPVSYALIAAAASVLFSWLAWSSRAADILERMNAPERRQPPQPPAPKDATVNLRIHEERGEFLEGVFLNRLPGGENVLIALAKLVISGRSLTTSQVCASGLLGRSDWEELRDRFVFAGLLKWRGGNRAHGCEVTPRGLAVFRRMASPHSPTGSDAPITEL